MDRAARTALPRSLGGRQGVSLGRDSAANAWIAPGGLLHPPHRTGLAPFRASGSPPYGLSLGHPLFHPHRWVLTSLLRRNLLRPYPSAAFLRHVAGFPDLGLLRRLCPTSSISRRLANSIAGELDADRVGTAPPMAGSSGWSAPSPSPNRACDFHHIRLSIRWVRPVWVGNIGFSAIIVGFIHPSSGVVRFVPHPSDCPPSPCGRLSRPRTTTRALPHVRHWLKAGLLRSRRAGRASQVRLGCVFVPS